MNRSRRVSMVAALMVCVAGAPMSSTLAAAEPNVPLEASAIHFGAGPARPPAAFVVPQFHTSDEQVYVGPPVPMYRHSNDGALAAILIGATAAITGTAVLVYANRPECSFNPYGGGCGYGTKVVGGAILAGGIVGLTVGALIWK